MQFAQHHHVFLMPGIIDMMIQYFGTILKTVPNWILPHKIITWLFQNLQDVSFDSYARIQQKIVVKMSTTKKMSKFKEIHNLATIPGTLRSQKVGL